ncbi:MAG: ACT domain-containing protein [Oscillospiraceae bacterium]
MLRLQRLGMEFAVCKVQSISEVNFNRDFVFLSKTDEEISLVCEAGWVPKGAGPVETGWRALKIQGILDFGMVGVISKIAAVLAGEGISIFVVSTYNTDYIFVKEHNLQKSLRLLQESGYTIL